jgi:hypothetical protein
MAKYPSQLHKSLGIPAAPRPQRTLAMLGLLLANTASGDTVAAGQSVL